MIFPRQHQLTVARFLACREALPTGPQAEHDYADGMVGLLDLARVHTGSDVQRQACRGKINFLAALIAEQFGVDDAGMADDAVLMEYLGQYVDLVSLGRMIGQGYLELDEEPVRQITIDPTSKLEARHGPLLTAPTRLRDDEVKHVISFDDGEQGHYIFRWLLDYHAGWG